MADTTKAKLMRRRDFLRGTVTALGTTAMATALTGRMSFGAERFPARPVGVVVAAKAGGGFDTLLRVVQPAWEERLGQPLKASFAPGAGGQIAAARVVAHPPDGYTVGLDAVTNFAVMLYFNKPENISLDGLHFIGSLMVEPVALLVRKDSPFDDLSGLLRAVRGGGDPVKIAVGGTRTLYHLVGAIFRDLSNAKNSKIITYASGGASRRAVISGEVDVVVTGLYAASSVYDQVRGLLVFAETNPIPNILDMATTKSLDFEMPQTLHPTTLYVRAETQARYPDRYGCLVDTFHEAMGDPRTRQAAKKAGLPDAALEYWSPDRLNRYKHEFFSTLSRYGGLLQS